jgi:ADP-ribose pyrophosphatase YjhB (NUDIX family)
MTNQTSLPVEKGYPQRVVLADSETGWNLELPDYEPPLHPEFSLAQERLEEAGLTITTPVDLAHLATLSDQQAAEEYGPVIQHLRNPLGRTGINGSGIFYHAGPSVVADMAVLRVREDQHFEMALVYNRGKWRLPGGFAEPGDNDDQRRTAIRETDEELNINTSTLDEQGLVETLMPRHVKPSSRRSTDFGFIVNQVETVLLPDFELGNYLRAGDDAEASSWFTMNEVQIARLQGKISDDHYGYMQAAFRHHLKTTEL